LCVDIDGERAKETVAMIEGEGGQAAAFAGDMSVASECMAMVSAALDLFGSVDILLNNIGRASMGTVVDLTEEEWDRAMTVNLRTAFLASKYVVPVMAAKGSGSIVNMSSISALTGDGTLAYSAAKGGLQAMTIDMAYSHGRQGIRVNAVAPGHIETPMLHSLSEPGPEAHYFDRLREAAGYLGTAGTGWDVAYAVLFLASDQARWITGITLPVDSGVLVATPLSMSSHLRAVARPEY
jgi:NAD(P)-dependent dehydrogenase (short-subunit alcohol dehydrogenase family)